MSPTVTIVLLWLGFAGSHLTLSSVPVRQALVAFFGGFPLFALIGAAHQDRRKLATDPRFRGFYEATPFVPFTSSAALQGIRELLPAAAGIGILVTVVVRYFHTSWFGG